MNHKWGYGREIMVVAGTHEATSVDKIELDRSNARIRMFLEMYGDDPTPEQIFLAFVAGNDDEADRQDGPTFQNLNRPRFDRIPWC